jgi:hypothetical protein
MRHISVIAILTAVTFVSSFSQEEEALKKKIMQLGDKSFEVRERIQGVGESHGT